MTELDTRILSALRTANALTATEIARDITAHRDVVQDTLHRLDDEGHVVMRNGFYRLSEAARMTRPGNVEHD